MSKNKVYSQDIEVNNFELMTKDQIASLSPWKDIKGTACGLVKVTMKEARIEFEGNVIVDVLFAGT